jgi:hypothetical protein
MIDLIVCSICLRVRRGSEWLDAEYVVRDIKSYDHSSTAPQRRLRRLRRGDLSPPRGTAGRSCGVKQLPLMCGRQ